jgi:hypothetical protein
MMNFEASPYKPAFVSKIKKSKMAAEKGKFIMLNPDKSLWENLGKTKLS